MQDDDELMELLRHSAAGHDAVPSSVRAMAGQAFAMRNFDAQLAELLDDSLISATVPSEVRDGAARELRYDLGARGGLTMQIIDRHVFGHLDTPVPCVAAVQAADAEPADGVQVDDEGYFDLRCPESRFRIDIDFADGHCVTEWLTA